MEAKSRLSTPIIIVFHPLFEILQILSPIVVGISSIEVAVFVSTDDSIEVGEIARIAEDGHSDDKEKEDTDEPGDELAGQGFVGVTFVKVGQGFTHEEIEKRQDRKEVAEADGEVAGNAYVAIEQDKEQSEILCDFALE